MRILPFYSREVIQKIIQKKSFKIIQRHSKLSIEVSFFIKTISGKSHRERHISKHNILPVKH
ncbi:MAG: hypothetical protein COA42_04105 [Alteromonadaceae bacterium]|nr:MAG: hypothetical protein COA42_04105 [Alteromonadaceae bacterium]